jgi:cytochrome c-type biogenesis protein CcmH/NrfF
MKTALFAVSFILTLTYMSGKYIFLTTASDKTVMGISHSLACPCECPMVLEDCHMSCGLSWKNLIGAKLNAGLGKEEIVSYFYKRYGREALLTPAQRVAGKWYQVTRGGYPVKEMTLFAVIVLVWTSLLYLILLTGAEKLLSWRKK